MISGSKNKQKNVRWQGQWRYSLFVKKLVHPN